MQNQANQNNTAQISIPRATSVRRVWLRVGTLIDGENRQPLRNAHIVYNAASIVYVADEKNPPPSNIISPGQSQPDFDLPEFTLLPGLVEAHAHLFLEGGELDPEKRAAGLKQPHAKLLETAGGRLERLILLGIVGVRDAGDKMGVGLSLSKLYSIAGRPLMPYIDSPGAAINHRGEYGSFMAEPVEDFRSPRECVISRINNGAERIKLIVSDVIDFKTGGVARKPQMTSGEVEKFVATAKEFKKQTFAHATGDRGIESAVEGGVDSVEHGFFIRDDQLERMRDRQIAWVPTFSPVQKQIDFAERMGRDDKTISSLRKILDQHSSSLLKANRLGVPIIAGSDAGAWGVLHGFGLLDELCLMEAAGLSSLQVLRSATGNSSHRLGFKDRFGIIKPGYRSRFILTRHSPLRGVSNLRKEKYVIFDGDVYNSSVPINPEGL
jgi:imidazolonepropionase-like amidohydrolase